MSAGVGLRERGRRIWLKWHQLRRTGHDPAHDRTNLRLGIEQGASLEVDIIATRDGHFVCVHDSELASETTGRGSVHAQDRSTVECFRQCGNDSRPLASPPLFLDEVLAALAAAPAEWPGRLQLDLKQPPELIDGSLIRRFAELAGPLTDRVILAGSEWPVVRLLGAAAPGLRLGFDPLAIHEAAPPASAGEYRALGADMLAQAPEAAIFYLNIPLVLGGLEAGVDLIAMAKGHGAEVDAWRLESEDEGAADTLATLIAAGVDQITTDSPVALEQLWLRRAS
jgi:glycerophosphoryl diester phosphodiesterase